MYYVCGRAKSPGEHSDAGELPTEAFNDTPDARHDSSSRKSVRASDSSERPRIGVGVRDIRLIRGVALGRLESNGVGNTSEPRNKRLSPLKKVASCERSQLTAAFSTVQRRISIGLARIEANPERCVAVCRSAGQARSRSSGWRRPAKRMMTGEDQRPEGAPSYSRVVLGYGAVRIEGDRVVGWSGGKREVERLDQLPSSLTLHITN